MSHLVFCSTVIATINRPTLTAAVLSVLEQKLDEDEYEIIVVNDSGSQLPGYAWEESRRVTIVNTWRRERSVARNTGAAIARGRYLHFLDGDDELLPGALRALWRLSQQTNAAWLYGYYQSLDRRGRVIADHRPSVHGDAFASSVAGELIPLQASLLRSDRFHEVGGFDPKFNIVEDYDLVRRFTLTGQIAGISEFVARIQTGREGSTGNWSAFAKHELSSREKILNIPGVLARLEKAVVGRNYWRGRVGRIYMASTVQNLRMKRVLVALDRFVSLVAFSRQFVLTPEYWRGVRRVTRLDPAEYSPWADPDE